MLTEAHPVKQEIAKEGILPFRKFLSRTYTVPIPNIFSGRVQNETPIGALFLHCSLSILLILATAAQVTPYASYRLLVSLYAYTIDAFFGLCLGLGLLALRFTTSTKWARKSRKVCSASVH